MPSGSGRWGDDGRRTQHRRELAFLALLTRDLFEGADGRQWVIGYEGKKVYGVWLMPADLTVMVKVEGRRGGRATGRTLAGTGLFDDGCLRVPEAAAFLGLSKSKLYEIMADGELAYTVVGGVRRVPKKALVELAERGLMCHSGTRR
jgi:excisionase family DNA binding protein